jgi:hypothetical protein
MGNVSCQYPCEQAAATSTPEIFQNGGKISRKVKDQTAVKIENDA